MTERCQNKFTEKFDNFNYIIYIGIICTSVAVLYFYRFHFTTIVFSYGLGCLACYYGLNAKISRDYVNKLKCHFIGETDIKKIEDPPKKKCSACGSKDCARHEVNLSTEPWVGLQIHKQLDQAIEDFYNTILEQFINTWYSKITLQPFFVDELRHQLRYASAILLQRALKVDYATLITHRLVPCALQHYASYRRRGVSCQHVAARSRAHELRYLRALTDTLMPALLLHSQLDNPVFKVLVRELFAGWVLLSLTDVLATPAALNALLDLALAGDKMAPLPTTPDYKVEFLETFARQTDSIYTQRCKLMKVDLESVMNDQEYFYSFMQFLKTTSHIYLLQFYKDIKSFQTMLLNPSVSAGEAAALRRAARELHDTYLSPASAARVPLPAALGQEILDVLQHTDAVNKLQTSRALYQAARQSHAILEKILLPKFLHSEEFYKLIIGSRIPVGYQKQLTRKPQDRLLTSAMRLGNKLKSALKSQNIDGQVLDLLSNADDESDENVDILKYLDTIAADESMTGQDLSTYKVVLTNVETRLAAAPRRGPVRVFSLAVHRLSRAGAALWAAERSEHDFHLLRSKLLEFHGEHLLHDLQLPSRRDNSPLETLRYKYEDFLQRLLQKSLLQTSELLRIFLTEDGDFSMFIQASSLNANSTDLVNIYQSVTHKLRKEKGQHLESFLRNLLVSSDIERYQALKQGTHVEEAQEMSEDIPIVQITERKHNKRDIKDSIFNNNMDIEDDSIVVMDRQHQQYVRGFTQCVMFTLTNVINARSIVSNVVGTVLGFTRHIVDDAFNKYLQVVLGNLLSERRLAHLIRLGHAMIFNRRPSAPVDPGALAKRAVGAARAHPAGRALGAGLARALADMLDMLQQPQLNKQLVYNLLDLCVAELFPELIESPSDVPKS